MTAFYTDGLFWIYFSIVLIILIVETIITTRGLKNTSYLTLKRPKIQPAPIVFSVAWLILFGIIIYAWYESVHNSNDTALNILFGINLLLNFLWVFVFFYQFHYVLSLVILILLVMETAFLVGYIYQFAPVAAYLLGLYTAWLIFATYLNYQYVMLNRN
jgi:benzodiazapine receptor